MGNLERAASAVGIGCGGHACASDFFEAVRDAAVELRAAERTLERMRSAEGVRGQGYTGAIGSSCGAVDGSAATDARMDFEGRMRRRMAEDSELIGLAGALLYGEDGRGGVRALVGPLCADSVWFRYCEAMKWTAVADMTGASVRACQNYTATAFDAIDSGSVGDVVAGVGTAEG